MDNFSSNNAITSITNGVIDNITSNNNSTFITVTYSDCINCTLRDTTVQLVAGRNTVILNETGRVIPVSELRVGMTINATVSSAMTRSIPPQTNAFVIQVVRRPASDNTTVGRIIDVDRQNRSFTTISDNNRTSIIRFNVSKETRFFDISGRPINFSRLVPGLRVRVRHANFMTASIPPQTTAFEVRIIR